MAISETPGYSSNLQHAKFKGERLTATNAAWIAPTNATCVIVMLSISWLIVSGTTPTILFTGATNYPGGTEPFKTTAGSPFQHHSPAGLMKSAVGGNIGVTLTGTTPVIAVSVTYVEYDTTTGKFI